MRFEGKALEKLATTEVQLPTKPGRNSKRPDQETMVKRAKLFLSILSAVAIFVAIIFIIATTSILESFQLYPHDTTGDFSLFLISFHSRPFEA